MHTSAIRANLVSVLDVLEIIEEDNIDVVNPLNGQSILNKKIIKNN